MKALKLAGMSERAQECYTRSVRKLVDFHGKRPDLFSEEEWSSNTMKIGYHAVKSSPDSTQTGQENAYKIINDIMKGFNNDTDK